MVKRLLEKSNHSLGIMLKESVVEAVSELKERIRGHFTHEMGMDVESITEIEKIIDEVFGEVEK